MYTFYFYLTKSSIYSAAVALQLINLFRSLIFPPLGSIRISPEEITSLDLPRSTSTFCFLENVGQHKSLLTDVLMNSLWM